MSVVTFLLTISILLIIPLILVLSICHGVFVLHPNLALVAR